MHNTLSMTASECKTQIYDAKINGVNRFRYIPRYAEDGFLWLHQTIDQGSLNLMEKDLIRKSKQIKRLNYAHYYPRTGSKNQFVPNYMRCSSQNSGSELSLFSKLNSNESHGISQANSTIMYSCEKIKIELNLSSEDQSLKCKSDNGEDIRISKGNTQGKTDSSKMNSDLLQVTKKPKTSIPDDMLSMDDSLLAQIDLSCYELEGQKKVNNENSNITNEQSCNPEPFVKHEPCDKRTNSPDIFNSNKEEDEELEDHPWDMSIVVDDADKKVESVPSHDSPVCQGLSEVVFSTWVSPHSPKLTQHEGTFKSLLKRALTNNGNKPKVSHSSPRSLFPENKGLEISSFFGLPVIVKQLIKKFKGISQLYEWQEECLNLPAIEKRKNLVYALPTSGGKTLVAEILVLKEILCRQKNVLFVLPYVSIAQEKVRALSLFAVELGFLVEEYAGSKGGYPPQKRRRKRSVYIATIEKALGLVHSLIECERIGELGLVVVDELHLIGEPRRGAHLESMLTKLIYLKCDVQVIGMSATIGNLSDIATFLQADVYTQNFRPVELTEFVKVDEELFIVDHSIENEVPLKFHSKVSFKYSQEQRQQDPDQVGALVKEVIPDHSCLVFCPSKKNCENVALMICNVFDRCLIDHKSEDKKALFRALLAEGNGSVCPILRKTLPFGVAYHHSGLTNAERSLLEEAFLAKTICCICCTSTLAAGVNLPARRVILRSPYVGTQFLTLSKYKQMIGRAGRTGLGDFGESFLICRPQDARKVGELLSSSIDVCESQLAGTGLECLIISSVDLALASSVETLTQLCRCSLLCVQGVDLENLISQALQHLIESGAVTSSDDKLTLSNIGKAAVKANIDMKTAQKLHTDLTVAQQSLVLLSHLHLLYLVTPYLMMDQITFNRQPFCDVFMQLGENEIQTAKVLGIGEQSIAQLMTGKNPKGSQSEVLHRFYLSLILFDLWSRTSVWKVSSKFSLPRGLIHNFLVSASAFSSSVVRFCEVLEDMWCFKLLLSEMSTRLTHCCTMELLPLMELPAVKLGRAKQLFNAGFKTLSIIAKTEPKTLVQAVDHMPRRIAHQIVAAAKLLLLSKVESLQEEAEEVLEGLQLN